MSRHSHAVGVPKWFLALSVAVLVVPPSAARRHILSSPEEIAFTQHMKRVNSFPCSKPQPRSFKSVEIIERGGDVALSPREVIYPVMTVLHRCDMGTGCCTIGSKHTCSPLKEEEVILDFKLVDHMTGGRRQVSVKAQNHTKCACVEASAPTEVF